MLRQIQACAGWLLILPCPFVVCVLQIHEEARKFSYQTGVRVVVAYGGAPITQQVQSLNSYGSHLLPISLI
jgi:superfamily II DNA/RNA helicase